MDLVWAQMMNVVRTAASGLNPSRHDFSIGPNVMGLGNAAAQDE